MRFKLVPRLQRGNELPNHKQLFALICDEPFDIDSVQPVNGARQMRRGYLRLSHAANMTDPNSTTEDGSGTAVMADVIAPAARIRLDSSKRMLCSSST